MFIRHFFNGQREYQSPVHERLDGGNLEQILAGWLHLLVQFDGAALPVIGSPLLSARGDEELTDLSVVGGRDDLSDIG